MSEAKDIERLVQRLIFLQLEQSKVIWRLQAVQKKSELSSSSQFKPGDRVVIIAKVNPPVGAESSVQDTIGKVISITPKRVKVRTDSGVTTSRAPHNLRKSK